MNAISRALSGLIEWIGKNQEVVKKVALIVAGVVAVGGAFIGIGSAAACCAFAVGGLASMFSLVGTAIGVLVTMIGACSPLLLSGRCGSRHWVPTSSTRPASLAKRSSI